MARPGNGTQRAWRVEEGRREAGGGGASQKFSGDLRVSHNQPSLLPIQGPAWSYETTASNPRPTCDVKVVPMLREGTKTYTVPQSATGQSL